MASLTWQITRHSLGIFSVPTIVLQTADVIPIREPRAREPCTISGYILGLHSKQHSFLGLTCIRKAEGKNAEGKKAEGKKAEGKKAGVKRRGVKRRTTIRIRFHKKVNYREYFLMDICLYFKGSKFVIRFQISFSVQKLWSTLSRK